MQVPATRFIEKYTWITALVITAFLFFLFNIISTPLLNSDDDAFLMYTLAGGYGEKPTALLQYDHIWHPWLGQVVKWLFIKFPGVNWYTVFLFLFHLGGSSAVFYIMLKKMKPAIAFFFFSIFFFFLEARVLLSFTFTAASFVAAAGAGGLLLYALQQSKLPKRNIVFAILLLLLAGMLRLQIVWLIIFLFIPVAITMLNKRQIVKWVIISVTIALALSGLNKIHEHYYIKNIAGWQEQEKFRQGLFYAYNRQLKALPAPSTFKDSTEQQLFMAGFLYDSAQFTPGRINEITKDITRKRSVGNKEDRQGLYWFFIGMRIYILLFGIVLAGLFINRHYSLVKKWFLSLLAVVLVHGYLFLFLKITVAIHLGLLMVLWLHLAMYSNRETIFFSQNKKIAIGTALAFVLLFGWIGIRVAEENNINKSKRKNFICVLTELNQSPQKLFVATDNSFPLDDFYIWDTPRQYQVKNLLYKERLLAHTWLKTLERFGINDLGDALLHNKNVFLLGKPLPALLSKYSAVKMDGPFPVYRCLEVWQLKKEE